MTATSRCPRIVAALFVSLALGLLPSALHAASRAPASAAPKAHLQASAGKRTITADLNEAIGLTATGTQMAGDLRLVIVDRKINKGSKLSGSAVRRCGWGKTQCTTTVSAAAARDSTYYAIVVRKKDHNVRSRTSAIRVSWKDLPVQLYADADSQLDQTQVGAGSIAPQQYTAWLLHPLRLHVSLPAGPATSWQSATLTDNTGATVPGSCAPLQTGTPADCAFVYTPQADPAAPGATVTRTFTAMVTTKDASGATRVARTSAAITVVWRPVSVSLQLRGFVGQNPAPVLLNHVEPVLAGDTPDSAPHVYFDVAIQHPAGTPDVPTQPASDYKFRLIDDTTGTAFDAACGAAQCSIDVPAPGVRSTDTYHAEVVNPSNGLDGRSPQSTDQTIVWGGPWPCGSSAASQHVCLTSNLQQVNAGTPVTLTAFLAQGLATGDSVLLTVKETGKTIAASCQLDPGSGTTVCTAQDTAGTVGTQTYTATVLHAATALYSSGPLAITWRQTVTGVTIQQPPNASVYSGVIVPITAHATGTLAGTGDHIVLHDSTGSTRACETNQSTCTWPVIVTTTTTTVSRTYTAQVVDAQGHTVGSASAGVTVTWQRAPNLTLNAFFTGHPGGTVFLCGTLHCATSVGLGTQLSFSVYSDAQLAPGTELDVVDLARGNAVVKTISASAFAACLTSAGCITGSISESAQGPMHQYAVVAYQIVGGVRHKIAQSGSVADQLRCNAVGTACNWIKVQWLSWTVRLTVDLGQATNGVYSATVTANVQHDLGKYGLQLTISSGGVAKKVCGSGGQLSCVVSIPIASGSTYDMSAVVDTYTGIPQTPAVHVTGTAP